MGVVQAAATRDEALLAGVENLVELRSQDVCQ